MIKHKWIGAAAAVLMAAAVLFTALAYLNPSLFSSVTGSAEPAYVSEINKEEIMSIQVIADEAQWADMLENASAEEYIPATVVINGTTVENVGIRPKGNSSLSMVARDDTTDRFSFKIEFDHYITGQTWKGLDKIVVNNMQGDASYMKEYLSYDIMDYIGVDAPLFAFADLSVNGGTWGLYLAVEALEESYAQRVHGQDHGMLYKPESMGMRGRQDEEDWQGQMPQAQAPQEQMPQAQAPQEQELPNQERQGQDNTLQNGEVRGGFGARGGFGGMGGMASNGVSLQYIDDDIESYSAIFDNAVFDATDRDYKRVVGALEKLSKGEHLDAVVDVEAVLKYFAAHTATVNLDSYVTNMGHNYYLYEKDGQLTILPWDYNLAFGGFQSGSASGVVNFPIDTPVSGVSLEDRPLLGKLLEVPEYLDLYHSYLQEIADGYFNSGLFEQTVDSVDARISSYVEKDPTAFYDYEAYRTAVTELKKLGLLRGESMKGQMEGSVPSTSEGQNSDSSKLIDASGVNLSALGSQGGGMGGGGNENRGQGGFGGMGGQPPEDIQGIEGQPREGGWPGADNAPADPNQGEGTRSSGARGPGIPGTLEAPGTRGAAATQETDSGTWLLLGGCVLLLLAGLAFVVLYPRRRKT